MTDLDLDTVRLLIFLGGLASMLVVETLAPVRGWRVSRGRRVFIHGLLASGNFLVLKLLTAGPALIWAGYVRDQGLGLMPWLGLTGPAEVLVSLVLLDLFNYGWHRANHRLPVLWRFHKVHHLDTHMDTTTSLRFHTGELFLSVFVRASWILIVGPTVLAFAVFEVATTLAAQFHHANIDLGDALDRRLRRWIVTPRYHAGHHTVARETRDSNYAVIFSLWDRLGGSYQDPDGLDLEYLGLEEGRETDLNLLPLLAAPMQGSFDPEERGT